MFTKEELRKYAETLWWGLSTARTGTYQPGDFILLRYDHDALPLAEAVYELLIEKGLNPVQRLNLTVPMDRSFFGAPDEDQLKAIAPGDRELAEHLNGLISLIAPASLTHLSGVDPKRIGTAAVARKFMRDIMEKREISGDFGWTLCAYPTPALAESARIDMAAYKEQIMRACFLSEADPTAKWKEIFDMAQTAKAWLNGMNVAEFHVESEHTDLWVNPGEQRRWLGVSGHNVPSFELFLSPDWRGTHGVYYADQPSFRSGNYVEGVRLEFKDGVAVDATAKQGEAFVKNQLSMDQGASRLGEFSLTDRRFSKIDTFMANTLFDENYGGEHGNCHVAVGASYADTFAGDQRTLDAAKKSELGFNDSALHWDLVNTEPKKVTAKLKDGSILTVYENGEFQY